jgi:hypothetical protein
MARTSTFRANKIESQLLREFSRAIGLTVAEILRFALNDNDKTNCDSADGKRQLCEVCNFGAISALLWSLAGAAKSQTYVTSRTHVRSRITPENMNSHDVMSHDVRHDNINSFNIRFSLFKRLCDRCNIKLEKQETILEH